MVRRTVVCAAMAVQLLTLAASAAETIESVEKKIIQQVDKCKSSQLVTRVTADISSGDTSMTTLDDIRSESLRKADKTLWRVEAKIKRVTKVGKQLQQTEEGTRLMIYDGQHIFTLTQADDQKTATKSAPNKQDSNPFDIKSNFDEIHKHCTLKLLPDAAVEGRDCYVIEAVRNKQDDADMPARFVTYYDKKTGLPMKSVNYDASGKILETMTVSDIKVNVDIPADRFVFKAPAGVPVLDMTKFAHPSSQPDTSGIPPELPDE